MQACISSIKKMVTEMFQAFKGLSSAAPLEPEVETIKKKPEHEHEDTKPISITIVRPTTNPTLEVELIRSSLGSQPTDLVIDITPPEKQPKIQYTTQKPDRGKRYS
ncbi:hypothetical protein Tco_0280852 [Tanacetum coccineum]